MELLSIILISAGILLLIAEIFLPSFGVAGILGIAAIIAGVAATVETIVGGILLFLGILAVAALLMFLAYKLFAGKRSRFILKDTVGEESPYDLGISLGEEGIALTPLRPAGRGEFQGARRLDVLTRGEFIEKGTLITVIAIEGRKVFVK